MASLYVEMAPGNWVFRVVDIAVKATDVKPGAQIVEREFGMFEIHSISQQNVIQAGQVVLEQLGLKNFRPQETRNRLAASDYQRQPVSGPAA